VLTGDFSADLSPERVLQKTLKYTESGSIVVFHDSLKAEKKMLYALPRMLQHFSELGYVFKTIAP
jgi:peptidoglycan/xylan/chitin deacetylase (PgdA/CDA1 family)